MVTRGDVTVWTDGWITPATIAPTLALCGACHHYVFCRELEVLGEVVYPEVCCTVVLTEAGDGGRALVQVLAKELGCSASEAEQLMSECPAEMSRGVSPDAAQALRGAVSAAGGRCDIHWQEEGPSSPKTWRDAPQTVAVREVDALRAFLRDNRDLSAEQERGVRQELYWAANHPYRDRASKWLPVDQRAHWERDNVACLERLLDPAHPADRFVLANLARESSRFDAAVRFIRMSNEVEPHADELLRLASIDVSRLRALSPLQPGQEQSADRRVSS